MHYLLDTTTVSHLIRKHPTVCERFSQTAIQAIGISVVTEAEILAGLAKKPQATKLANTLHSFLAHTNIYPFDSETAEHYAQLQYFLMQSGKALSAFDVLIAAHAKSVGATLVTSDKAFYHIADFVPVEDWTQAPNNELHK